MLHCAFSVVLRLGLQAVRSLTWSHSSAGQSVRLTTVRSAAQARVGPVVQRCFAKRFCCCFTTCYTSSRIRAGQAKRSIIAHLHAQPSVCALFSNIPDHKPDICVFCFNTQYTKPGCHFARVCCISGHACLPPCCWHVFPIYNTTIPHDINDRNVADFVPPRPSQIRQLYFFRFCEAKRRSSSSERSSNDEAEQQQR